MNRRQAMGQFVAASAALAAPAAVSAAAVDPHLEWEREAQALQARLDGERGMEQDLFDELLDEWNELGELIAETPAATLAGIAVQLRLTKAGFEHGSAVADYARATAVDTALASIEQLGGRASA